MITCISTHIGPHVCRKHTRCTHEQVQASVVLCDLRYSHTQPEYTSRVDYPSTSTHIHTQSVSHEITHMLYGNTFSGETQHTSLFTPDRECVPPESTLVNEAMRKGWWRSSGRGLTCLKALNLTHNGYFRERTISIYTPRPPTMGWK